MRIPPLFIAIALGVSFGVAPVHAQTSRPESPLPVDAGSRIEEIGSIESARQQSALAWARARALPLSTKQRDGGLVTIVAAEGTHPVYLTTFNANSAVATGAVYLRPGERLGLDLTGNGMDIGLWDGGHARASHRELAGRVVLSDNGESEDHATHVAGTLAAYGVSPEARGMASEARILSYDWDNDATEMANEAQDGLLISNHSYGQIAGWFYGELEDDIGDEWYWVGDPSLSTSEDADFGRYGTEAVQIDRVAATFPFYLPVVAAGNDRGQFSASISRYRTLDANGDWQWTVASASMPQRDGGEDGFDSISGMSNAKNILTVGSVGLSGPSFYRGSSFSSFGPTDDGRIKPDVVGYGENVYSSIATDDAAYARYNGTSMATPNVAGSLLLLQQLQQELRGTYMRAATLKALAIHTPRDLGTSGPDYKHGWGLVNVEEAALLLESSLQNPLAVSEALLENNAVYERSVTVTRPGPVRLTLCWTDPEGRALEGLDVPTASLVNDLDLRLIRNETGDVFYPFAPDPSRPMAAALRADNARDPVEQVFVVDASPGAYTVRISAKRALAAGRQQPFSLIVSGAEEAFRPVLVESGAASTQVDRAQVRWKTGGEQAPGTFRVERLEVLDGSGDARTLGSPVVVARIPTSGDAARGAEYSLEDAHLLSGSYVYRIYFEGADLSYLAAEYEARLLPPKETIIVSNYPNPFLSSTTLVVDLAYRQTLKMEVYDLTGRRLSTLIDGMLPAGRHELRIDASNWAPGMLIVRIQAHERTMVHKILHVG